MLVLAVDDIRPYEAFLDAAAAHVQRERYKALTSVYKFTELWSLRNQLITGRTDCLKQLAEKGFCSLGLRVSGDDVGVDIDKQCIVINRFNQQSQSQAVLRFGLPLSVVSFFPKTAPKPVHPLQCDTSP